MVNLSNEIIFSTKFPKQEEYCELFETTGWNKDYKLTSEELHLSIQNSSYCISAYNNEKLVGFGRMLSDGIVHAVIFDVIILPEFQRKGIGNKIMEKLLEECKKNKIRDIQLFCADGKIEFYKNFGFKARPEECPGMEIRNQY